MFSNRDVLIRVNSTSLEFPYICPICGQEATHHRYISRSKKSVDRDSAHSYRRYDRWFPPLPAPSTRFSLDIPVCEKHYKSSSELGLSRTMTGIIVGLSAPMSIALGVFIGFNWYDGIRLPFEMYLLTILSLVVLFWSLKGLSATDLDRVISIVDYVQGNPAIIIRVKSGWYADELLAMNRSSRVVSFKRTLSI